MGYDYKTNTYTFDFDQVSFPIQLSENVINYLYYDFIGNRFNYTSLEDFKKILRGEDRSQNACRILDDLYTVFNGHRQMPTEEFDIVTDEIVKTVRIREDKTLIKDEDYHQGICKYGELLFEFTYKVLRTQFGLIKFDFEEFQKSKSKVKLKGHTLEVENSYMHEACQNYLQIEKELEEKKIREQIEKEEKERWDEFKKDNGKKIREWIIPYIDHPYRGHVCPRVSEAVHNGILEYWIVSYVDHGKCYRCSAFCRFKEHELKTGEHSEKWYELGLDKLNIKYL